MSPTAVTYTRYEMLRTFRNTRFFIFSLIFPLVLFLLVAGPNRDAELAGISFPLYYMTGMVSWGTMMAVIGGGARIAAERSARLEPSAPHHPAAGRTCTSGPRSSPATPWPPSRSRCSTSPARCSA